MVWPAAGPPCSGAEVSDKVLTWRSLAGLSEIRSNHRVWAAEPEVAWKASGKTWKSSLATTLLTRLESQLSVYRARPFWSFSGVTPNAMVRPCFCSNRKQGLFGPLAQPTVIRFSLPCLLACLGLWERAPTPDTPRKHVHYERSLAADLVRPKVIGSPQAQHTLALSACRICQAARPLSAFRGWVLPPLCRLLSLAPFF